MASGASVWRAYCFLEESKEGRTAFYEQQGKKKYSCFILHLTSCKKINM
jgi:hypothetical protein